MRVLFYDDDLRRHRGFEKLFGGTCEIIYTTNNRQALAALSNEKFDVVFLDHDMDGEIYQPSNLENGWGIAKFISEMSEEKKPKEAVVHSMNELAAPEMVRILSDSGIKSNWYIFNCPQFRDVMNNRLAVHLGYLTEDEINANNNL